MIKSKIQQRREKSHNLKIIYHLIKELVKVVKRGNFLKAKLNSQ